MTESEEKVSDELNVIVSALGLGKVLALLLQGCSIACARALAKETLIPSSQGHAPSASVADVEQTVDKSKVATIASD